jgi:hypothetical protein
VQVTIRTNDGGIDVMTSTHCCQVKNYDVTKVSVNEVRELFGVACSLKMKPLLFTSTSLTQAAEEFCALNAIAVIRFDAVLGELMAVNWDGDAFLRSCEFFHADSNLSNFDVPF